MTAQLEVYTADSPVHPRQLEADELGRADRDAALYCLRHSLSRDRVRMAARLMVSSVWTQAAMVGVLGCGHCADAGCWWCQP